MIQFIKMRITKSKHNYRESRYNCVSVLHYYIRGIIKGITYINFWCVRLYQNSHQHANPITRESANYYRIYSKSTMFECPCSHPTLSPSLSLSIPTYLSIYLIYLSICLSFVLFHRERTNGEEQRNYTHHIVD